MASSSRRQRRRIIREDSPEEEQHQQPPPAPLPPLFFSEEFEAKFNNDYSTRTIVEGKQFNVELFSSNGLQIHALFRRQCIIKFLTIKENVFPRLVRLFYANLHHPIDDNGDMDRTRLVTMLNGKTISFTKTDLVGIFGFPTNNVTEVPSNFGNLLGFNRDSAINLLVKNRYKTLVRSNTTEIKASMLKLSSRLIHSIIGYCIVPRRGTRATCNQLDFFLVWAISMGYKVDYASLMFHHLVEITNRKKQGLVYGMALTRFFKFYDIELNDETDVIVPTDNELYTTKTLRLMQYSIQRGQWVPNDPRDIDDSEDEDEEEERNINEDEELPTQIPPGSSSRRPSRATQDSGNNASILQAIQSLSLDMHARFNRIEDRQRAHEAAFIHYHPEYEFPEWQPWEQPPQAPHGWAPWPSSPPQE